VPYVWAALLTLLVAGPWLLPGFIFGTDWPGPRRFFFPDQISSSALFDVALASVSAALGAELTTKLVLIGALFLAALGSFRALPAPGFAARAVAATIFTVNPFVYGRIHYGQLLLIAGYSLLPWLAIALRRLVLQPALLSVLSVVMSLTLIGLLDLHLLIPAGLLAVTVVIAFGLSRIRDAMYLLRLGLSSVASAGVAILASSYWLIPLVRGSNQQGRQVAGFGLSDLMAFRTVPDGHLGLLPNVLGLYGFWAENVNRFPSMKEFVRLWPLILLILLGLGAIGAVVNLVRHVPDFVGARPWILALCAAGSAAVLLEMGVADPHIRPLVQWLDSTFPIYRGMRDAGKWAALIALAYAQLVPLGAIAILGWLRRRSGVQRVDVFAVIGAAVLLALPLYYGNGLLFGMHAQVRPSAYPAGWYAADSALLSDRQPGRTLFLPWHLYLKFGFIKNTNAVIATPAPAFFSVPVLVSADPEIPGLRPANTREQALLARLVAAHGAADWPQALSTIDIKYVLLAREVDWRDYQFLGEQPGLMKVGDYGSIVLYRNLDWRGP
jgi:hypothetical protein